MLAACSVLMKSPSFQSTWNLKDPFVAHLVASLLNSLPSVLIEMTESNFYCKLNVYLFIFIFLKLLPVLKDLLTAMHGNGLWRIRARFCGRLQYKQITQTALITFLSRVQISVLWHLATLEPLMSLESPCRLHDWSFFTRPMLLSFSDEGSVYILTCTGIKLMCSKN